MLVGLPGAGKSTVGPMIAERLGRGFVDLDERVERLAGRSIPEVFAREGESAFRRLELEATRTLAPEPELVVAPGGGWITSADAVALLVPPGVLAYLRISPEGALRRLGVGVASRPLLAGDALARLRGTFSERREYYERAELVLDVEHLSPQQVTAQVVDGLGKLRRPAV